MVYLRERICDWALDPDDPPEAYDAAKRPP